MQKGKGYAAALALMIGVATPIYVSHEGTKTLPYKDIVNVWTVCSGDTRNVTPGVRETPESCRKRTEKILTEFGDAVAEANPDLVGYKNEWGSHTIFAANIGIAAYKKSTVYKLAKAGEHRQACRFMLKYEYAGGKPVIGLINRRAGTTDKIGEYELCLADAVERDIGAI